MTRVPTPKLIKEDVRLGNFELTGRREIHRIEHPFAVGSNPTGHSSQLPDNREVTINSKSSQNSENQKLVSGLFLESENDPDLKLILQRWPGLPEHIKAAIKALVQTHKMEKK